MKRRFKKLESKDNLAKSRVNLMKSKVKNPN